MLTFGNIESPYQRAEEKRKAALIWLNRWGYTTPEILAALTKTQLGAGAKLARQMVKAGIFREVACSAGGYTKYLPIDGKRQRVGPYLLMLTNAGKEMAVAYDLCCPEGAQNPRQVSSLTIVRHNLLCQMVVARRIGPLDEYLPEPSAKDVRPGYKKADCLITEPSENCVEAIEIELSPKNGADLHNALCALGRSFHRGDFDTVSYHFSSPKAMEKYQQLWLFGDLQTHVKTARAGYYEVEDFSLHHQYRDLVSFRFDPYLQIAPPLVRRPMQLTLGPSKSSVDDDDYIDYSDAF